MLRYDAAWLLEGYGEEVPAHADGMVRKMRFSEDEGIRDF
jgi:hypothetical protein